MGFLVHSRNCPLARPFSEAEHRSAFWIEPIRVVLHAVFLLGLEIEEVGVGHVFGRNAGDIVTIDIHRHGPRVHPPVRLGEASLAESFPSKPPFPGRRWRYLEEVRPIAGYRSRHLRADAMGAGGPRNCHRPPYAGVSTSPLGPFRPCTPDGRWRRAAP